MFDEGERLTDCIKSDMKSIRRRDYRHFKNQEFLKGLDKIDWPTTLAGTSAKDAFKTFYTSVEYILNVMAPTKLLNKKGIRMLTNLWLTKLLSYAKLPIIISSLDLQ